MPGLIISIKDLDNHHEFNLIQIKNIHGIYQGISEKKGLKKMTMNELMLKSKLRKFNPKSDIDFIKYSNLSGVMTIATKDGNYINLNAAELKKYQDDPEKYDAEIAKRLRISNNPLELDY